MPENEDLDKDLDDGLPEEQGSDAALREIEKDDDVLLSPKKPNKMLIAGLSVVIFLALFIFFKGDEETVEEQGIDIQTPSSEMSSSASEKIFEESVIEEKLNGGEILIAGEETEAKPEATDENIVPITKEELSFFDPLSDTESERPPSESEDMALVKAEIPKPAPPQAAPKPKKAAKVKKTAEVFTIQVGAFKGREGADKLDDQLRHSGYDSFVLVMPNDVYRVRVGSFKSRSAAEQVAARIKKTDHLDSFITTE